MADRYQDRHFPPRDDHDRDDPRAPAKGDSDPLAELARLIGQSDPFAMGRANQPVVPARPQYQPPASPDGTPAAGPPPWMQRANRQESPAQDYEEAPEQEYQEEYPSAVHPLHRYAAQHAATEPEYHPAPPSAATDHAVDSERYDDALYGQLDTSTQDLQPDPAYPDNSYAYQDSYDEGAEEPAPKRGGGMITVAVVLALAVLGTGAAFAYRTYVGSPRSGDPPIIKAETSPTKIVPTPMDANAKLPDRMAAGDGAEKIVPREEAPVDINAKSGTRVVFPPLNQGGAVSAGSTGSGALAPNEPRKIKTFSVPGEANGAAAPVIAPTATQGAPGAAKPSSPTAARAAVPPGSSVTATRTQSAAPAGNAPLSLSPQNTQAAPAAAEPRTRVAATAPELAAPSGGGGGNYLVQVSSQRNEADAQASYRALQGKFPAVLGSRAPVIKRADLGEKGVYYRAMVGPFGSTDEAAQFCVSLKTAGGQCVVQRN